MIVIYLYYRNASGIEVRQAATVPLFADMPPALVTLHDGPKLRYFTRYAQSLDYYETEPVPAERILGGG